MLFMSISPKTKRTHTKKQNKEKKKKKEKERKRSPGSRQILKMKLHIARKNESHHTKYCVN